MHRIVALGLMTLVLGSCADIMEPNSRPDDFYPSGLHFGAPSEEMFAEASSPPLIRVRPSRVVVLGVLKTPCSGYAGQGTVDVAADTVTLRVSFYWSNGRNGCLAAISGAPYRASIDVAPGTYLLRIRHEPVDSYFGFTQDTVVRVR